MYVGGWFSAAGGTTANNIARWNGASWSTVGSGISGTIYAMVVYNGELYVGGYFGSAGGNTANSIAKWNGSSWQAVGSGMNEEVLALAVYSGELYAGGRFTSADGNSANHIAKWNGTSWSALGVGTDTTVHAMCTFKRDLYVGGEFATAGGLTANHIAKWNNPVGIKENKNITQINIYPNPARDRFTLSADFDEKVTAEITDISGKLIDIFVVPASQRETAINTQTWKNGFYFLKLNTKQGQVTKKSWCSAKKVASVQFFFRAYQNCAVLSYPFNACFTCRTSSRASSAGSWMPMR